MSRTPTHLHRIRADSTLPRPVLPVLFSADSISRHKYGGLPARKQQVGEIPPLRNVVIFGPARARLFQRSSKKKYSTKKKKLRHGTF